jgi:integrase
VRYFPGRCGGACTIVIRSSAPNSEKEWSRDRTLTDAELAIIWNALRDSDYSDIVRLLILTGQRANEIGKLPWKEIDFHESVISLPPTRTKNARAHSIPM